LPATPAQRQQTGLTGRTIAGLYGELAAVAPSPVVELNRAVAIGMAEGPQAALTMVDRLADEPALKAYHLLPSVRGDLLYRLRRFGEACAAFEAASALASRLVQALTSAK